MNRHLTCFLGPHRRVAYEAKRRWKDGTTHVVMTAPVPRPRRHLVT